MLLEYSDLVLKQFLQNVIDRSEIFCRKYGINIIVNYYLDIKICLDWISMALIKLLIVVLSHNTIIRSRFLLKIIQNTLIYNKLKYIAIIN